MTMRLFADLFPGIAGIVVAILGYAAARYTHALGQRGKREALERKRQQPAE